MAEDDRIPDGFKDATVEMNCNMCDNGYTGPLDNLDIKSWIAGHMKAQGHGSFSIRIVGHNGYIYKQSDEDLCVRCGMRREHCPHDDQWEDSE